MAPLTGEPRRLPAGSAAVRVAALLAVCGLVGYGTLAGNDDQWPFAPMSQFAFRVGPDDSIRSTYLVAWQPDGRQVRVPLSTNGVGIGRAEIEGQLPDFERDPALLGSVAVAAHRQHPDWPAYVRLELRQQVTPLHRGRLGRPHDVVLATWTPTGASSSSPSGAVGSQP